MSHKIIENNKEIYIIFEGVIEVEDFNDSHLLDSINSNKNVTIELKNITENKCQDGLAGLYFIGMECPNVVLKGFSEDYKKSLDKLINL